MAEKIHKYTGPEPNSPIDFTLDLPYGFEPLTFALQNGKVTLWAAVDPKAKMTTYTFYIRGTGYNIPEDAVYLNTIFDGTWVWHIFYQIPAYSRELAIG